MPVVSSYIPKMNSILHKTKELQSKMYFVSHYLDNLTQAQDSKTQLRLILLSFLQGTFRGGAKSIAMQISFVMLIFLLFSDQISGEQRGEGQTASMGVRLWEKASLLIKPVNSRYSHSLSTLCQHTQRLLVKVCVPDLNYIGWENTVYTAVFCVHSIFSCVSIPVLYEKFLF